MVGCITLWYIAFTVGVSTQLVITLKCVPDWKINLTKPVLQAKVKKALSVMTLFFVCAEVAGVILLYTLMEDSVTTLT